MHLCLDLYMYVYTDRYRYIHRHRYTYRDKSRPTTRKSFKNKLPQGRQLSRKKRALNTDPVGSSRSKTGLA